MKKNIFDQIPIAIVAIILSAATSFAVTKAKVDSLEKTADKNEKVLEDMREFRTEQRTKMDRTSEDLKELKSDMKEILKAIKDR